MTITNSNKRCSHCKQNKLVEAFGKNKAMKDGYQNQCKTCRSKHHWLNRDRLNRKCRKWYQANKKRVYLWNRAYDKTDKGRQVKADSQSRYRDKHPEKYMAHNAVTSLINQEKLPPAKTLRCEYCSHQATGYHHYLGYIEAHWTDVIPLCTSCHIGANQETRIIQ